MRPVREGLELMVAFGARVRFVTDAGKPPEESPIGFCGTWRPDKVNASLGHVKLDTPLWVARTGGTLSTVRASESDLEEL